MVHDEQFEKAIREKIGAVVNTEEYEKKLDTLKGQLRQLLGTKSRLETQMDTLDVTDPHYDRKILDLQRRYINWEGRFLHHFAAVFEKIFKKICFLSHYADINWFF